MALIGKDINFGKIDHFLFVRINCICTDLGLTTKEFVENSYYMLVNYIDQWGITHFMMVRERYEQYADYREHTRYAPRIMEQDHSFVVQDIHEEIHKHLVVIKEENKFGWRELLTILLMTMETELDKIDAEKYKADTLAETVRNIFSDNRNLAMERGIGIDKTKKCQEFESQRYPERGIELPED